MTSLYLLTEHRLILPVQLEEVGRGVPVDDGLELALQGTLAAHVTEETSVELEVHVMIVSED